MNKRYSRLILVLGSLALALIAAFINIKAKQKSVQAEKEVFLRLKKNTGPVIRGFQYSNYHEGKKALNIRAAKFSIEKKKVGLFKLSPFKIACFRGAEIDLFGERHQHGNEKRSPRNKSANNVRTAAGGKDISFKGLLSQETLPTNALKGSVSAICEPVKINLYMDGVLVTSIQAEKAVVDPRRRRMILKKNIQAESGDTNLSANRLAIYPEKGVFEIENEYVLKKQDQTINGDKLTTDFLLEEVSTQ